MTRTQRQEEVVRTWAGKNGRATIVAYTGFGKTYLVRNAVQKMMAKWGGVATIVIVPTTELKLQWEAKAVEWNLDITVVVINGKVIKKEEIEFINNTKEKYKLAVMDEVHMYIDGPLFSTIFELCRKIRYQMTLSATVTYAHKRKLYRMGLPVVEEVTLEEGIANGWVAEFKQYNWGLELNPRDRAIYNKYYQSFESYFAYFEHKWNDMICCTKELPWEGNGKKHKGARKWCMDNELGLDAVKDTIRNANQGLRQNQNYRSFLHKHPDKLIAVTQILNKYPELKAITFGQVTECADELVKLNPGSRACHSNIEGEEFPKGFLAKYGYGNRTYLGKDSLNELIVQLLRNGEINTVHSAKKLVMGLDVVGLQLIVVYGFIRSERNRIQTIGRGLRKEQVNGVNKETLIINPYFMDTADQDWLEDSQRGMRNIITINNLDEM